MKNALKKHSKAISLWSGIGSAAGFLSLAAQFVPGHYQVLATAFAGLLGAISAVHASNSGPAAPPVPPEAS